MVKHFSAPFFVFTIVASLATYLVLFMLLAPATWNTQFQASIVSHVSTFLVCHFVLAIFEHLFHRYILHCPFIPGLSRFYKAHTWHHGLTHVVMKKAGIENYYPIIEEKQHEKSFFPWYSYLVFAFVITGPLIVAQSIFVTTPVLFEGYLALAFSISLYELMHAKEHKPLAKWLPKLEHKNPRIRKFWRTAYAFHLRHHVDPKCNEGIGAFFGIPVADLIFGTWVNPSVLYKHGSTIDQKEFISPRPVFFIRWLDDFAERTVKRRREKLRKS